MFRIIFMDINNDHMYLHSCYHLHIQHSVIDLFVYIPDLLHRLECLCPTVLLEDSQNKPEEHVLRQNLKQSMTTCLNRNCSSAKI